MERLSGCGMEFILPTHAHTYAQGSRFPPLWAVDCEMQTQTQAAWHGYDSSQCWTGQQHGSSGTPRTLLHLYHLYVRGICLLEFLVKAGA